MLKVLLFVNADANARSVRASNATYLFTTTPGVYVTLSRAYSDKWHNTTASSS